jgi:hypothetical protein
MKANMTFATGGFLHRTRFVLVNNRVHARTDTAHCAAGLSRKATSAIHNTPDLLRHAMLSRRGRYGDARRQRSREESVMKCSNPNCNRDIGLIAHRRGWFSNRRYCSRNCRDLADLPNRSRQKQSVSTYFGWLFLQSIENPSQKLMPAVICIRAR